MGKEFVVQSAFLQKNAVFKRKMPRINFKTSENQNKNVLKFFKHSVWKLEGFDGKGSKQTKRINSHRYAVHVSKEKNFLT